MIKIYKVKVEGKMYEVEVELLAESDQFRSTNSTPNMQNTPVPVIKCTGEHIVSPMQGNIWKILKKVGDSVKAGETMLILEAMKMENNIISPKDGIIESISVKEGDSVDSGTILVILS